ncbi:MAG: hypothetical protein ACOZDD_15765 [Bacteroidota bacterium]
MLPDLENIQAQTRQLIQTGFIPPLQQCWEDHRRLVGNYLEIVRKYEKRLRGDEPPDNQGVAFMHDTVALLSGFVRPEALLRFDDEFEEYFVRSSGYVELFPLEGFSCSARFSLSSLYLRSLSSPIGQDSFAILVSDYPAASENHEPHQKDI